MKFDTKSRKRLLEWLEGQNISAYKFCRMIDGTHPNVWLWVHGNSRPSYKYAAAIQEITDGFVTVEGWSALCQPAKHPDKPKHKTNGANDNNHALESKRPRKARKQVA